MKTLKFNSTIKCTGCLEKVTSSLNEVAGTNNWEVDLKSPNKVLSVNVDGVTKDQIKDALSELGYSAELID